MTRESIYKLVTFVKFLNVTNHQSQILDDICWYFYYVLKLLLFFRCCDNVISLLPLVGRFPWLKIRVICQKKKKNHFQQT